MSWIRGKVALITGANTGIGLETARGLARAGATVIMTARDVERGRAAIHDVMTTTGREDVELLHLDLASFDSVRRAADEVKSKHDRLHLLVNNAGLVLSERRETEDGLEATLGINHFGPFLLTRLLEPMLRASAPARVVNVSSDAHRRSPGLDFDDLMRTQRKYSGMAAYCDSKLANILFTRALARRLDGSGVVTHALHPGVVRTGFARDGDVKGVLDVLITIFRPLFLSPEAGAKTSLHVATSDDAGTSTGDYWSKERRATPEAPARDDAAATRLWDASIAITGS